MVREEVGYLAGALDVREMGSLDNSRLSKRDRRRQRFPRRRRRDGIVGTGQHERRRLDAAEDGFMSASARASQQPA